MLRKLYISVSILFVAFTVKAQANALWKTISKQEAMAMIEHSKSWFQTTASYSLTISHATYEGYDAISPHEKQNGYFKKYANGFHSSFLGINTIQNKNYLFTLDTSKHIILVSNPVKSFEPVNASDLDGIQKRLDKCSAIKLLETGQTKTLRLEFTSKDSPVSIYEFCLNKDGLPKSIMICYTKEVKSVKGAIVKPKLIIEMDNYKIGITPAKNELNDAEYFQRKDKNVLVLNDNYKKFSLLDQRVPTNLVKNK